MGGSTLEGANASGELKLRPAVPAFESRNKTDGDGLNIG